MTLQQPTCVCGRSTMSHNRKHSYLFILASVIERSIRPVLTNFFLRCKSLNPKSLNTHSRHKAPDNSSKIIWPAVPPSSGISLSPKLIPATGHQKIFGFVQAARNTRCEHYPSGNANKLRRNPRRPKVSNMTRNSVPTGNSNVCAIHCFPLRESIKSGSNAPNIIKRWSMTGSLKVNHMPNKEVPANQNSKSTLP